MKNNFENEKWVRSGYYVTNLKGEVMAVSPLANLPENIEPSDEQITHAENVIKLCASAPDLLNALQRATNSFMQRVNGVPSDKDHWYNVAMEAIKKATE